MSVGENLNSLGLKCSTGGGEFKNSSTAFILAGDIITGQGWNMSDRWFLNNSDLSTSE